METGLAEAAVKDQAAVMPFAKSLTVAFVVLGLAALGAPAMAASAWRPLDLENTLVVDTTKGRIVIEMSPELAPLAVARVKLLTREHLYDGLLFHRVIDGFVDQTGNPNNQDGGTSSHPNLAPEFVAHLPPDRFFPVRQAVDSQQGFVGALPVEAVSAAEAGRAKDGKLRLWGAYCPGVAGMGRQADPGSANSELFFMRDAARRLDRDYTVWGKVVVGLDVIRAVAIGEPPANPDKMLTVRVAADMPPKAQPKYQMMDERGPVFASLAAKLRKDKGADFSVCDVVVPARGH